MTVYAATLWTTHARTRCTGSGAPSPPTPSAASQPTGSCARSRVAVCLAAPSHPQRRHHRSTLTTRQAKHRPIRLKALPRHFELQLVQFQPAERGQVGAREGSVRHVELLPDGQRQNSHHRKTSTPTQPLTRRPALHPLERSSGAPISATGNNSNQTAGWSALVSATQDASTSVVNCGRG